MYFDSADEYTTEIALVRASIRRTLESQRYGSSRSGSANESQRVALPELRTYLKDLITERDILTADASAPINRIYAKPGRRW